MSSQKNFNVTIIDDDPLMREMISDYLNTHFTGSTVTHYQTGEDALAADLNKQQLIILDYYLAAKNQNNINGLQVLIKLHQAYAHLPVIVLSGQESPEVAANTVKHGAWDYIIKNDNTFNRLGVEINKLIDRAAMINETAARSKMVRMSIIIAVLMFAGLLAIRFV